MLCSAGALGVPMAKASSRTLHRLPFGDNSEGPGSTGAGLTGAGLTLELEKVGDRWATRILGPSPTGRPVCLSRSVEGDATQTWPPSPPFQEIQALDAPAPVFFASGQCGRAYWSAALERRAPHEICCDIACRTPDPPPNLGSRFLLAAEGRLEVVGPTEIRLLVPPYRLVVQVSGPTAQLRPWEDRLGQVGWEVHVPEDPGPYPATIRWKYVLRGLDCGRED